MYGRPPPCQPPTWAREATGSPNRRVQLPHIYINSHPARAGCKVSQYEDDPPTVSDAGQAAIAPSMVGG